MHPVIPPTSTFSEYLSGLTPQAARLLNVLEADWRTISRTSPVPRHADIDPVALHHALPHAFVASRTTSRSLRIRVAGQALQDLFRFDPRGMSVGCFFADDAADAIVGMLDDMLDQPAILCLPLMTARRFGKRRIRAQLLALPLTDATGQVTKLMGALVTDDSAATSGARFALAEGHPVRREVLGSRFADGRATDPTRPPLRLVVDNTRQ